MNGIPPINTQSAKTQVLVRDGATAVIGGIYQSNEQTSQNRTPFLGRLPILGLPVPEPVHHEHEQRAAPVHHPPDNQGMSRHVEESMKVRALVIFLALGMVACVPDYVSRDEADVLFLIVAINGGTPFESSVTSLSEDLVGASIAVRVKNQNFDNVPQVPMAVTIEQYEVRYFRTDGRNTEGVDVPYRHTGGLRTAVDVTDAENTIVLVPLVRLQAKQEPPLRNLAAPGTVNVGASSIVIVRGCRDHPVRAADQRQAGQGHGTGDHQLRRSCRGPQ